MGRLFSIFGPGVVLLVGVYLFHGLVSFVSNWRFQILADKMNFDSMRMQSPEARYTANVRSWIRG